MKKAISLLIIAAMLISITSCGSKEMKTLHCDNCGKAVEVEASSNMNEDWILYCTDCEKELGLDTIVDDVDMPFTEQNN